MFQQLKLAIRRSQERARHRRDRPRTATRPRRHRHPAQGYRPLGPANANINAAAIQIGGAVRGNLSASTRVEILPSGVLTGTLKTGSFSAADGASVKGEIWVDRAGLARAVELRSGT